MPTIVVADDDIRLVKAIATRLEAFGYRVIQATDGYSALARAVEHKPDLLILDIHMPAGDGFTVQERKERLPEISHIPVIYITGDKSAEPRKLARQYGAFALLHKPVDKYELLDIVDAALRRMAA
jgi:DNA-binding response OmpR family regulator